MRSPYLAMTLRAHFLLFWGMKARASLLKSVKA
jgi:hypothetical protein